jgi:hypothetical protein
MNFDKPPDLWTLVLIGIAAVILLGCGCCCTAALIPFMERGGIVKFR